jgi:hypothetical protein
VNWMEWLGAIGSITTIIGFVMYLRERGKRKNHDANGRISPRHQALMERVGQHQVVQQINDMLSRLQPPKGKS